MEKVELVQLRTRTYMAEPAKPCLGCSFCRVALKHVNMKTPIPPGVYPNAFSRSYDLVCDLDPENPVKTQQYATCGAWERGGS